MGLVYKALADINRGTSPPHIISTLPSHPNSHKYIPSYPTCNFPHHTYLLPFLPPSSLPPFLPPSLPLLPPPPPSGLAVVYLLPFDSLLIPMTLEQRLVLAQAYARSIVLPEEGSGLGSGQGQEPGPGSGSGPGSGQGHDSRQEPGPGPGSGSEQDARQGQEPGLVPGSGSGSGQEPVPGLGLGLGVGVDSLLASADEPLIERPPPPPLTHTPTPTPSTPPHRPPPRLRLGFISYDFNDHPTAHLVEAIFDVVRRRAGEAAGREANNTTATATTTIPPATTTATATSATATTPSATATSTAATATTTTTIPPATTPSATATATAATAITTTTIPPATTTSATARAAIHQPHRPPRRRVFRSAHLVAYSYGHNDRSTYRTRLEALADEFVDLAHVAHAHAR